MSLLSFRKDRVDRVVAGKYAPYQATVTTYRAGATVNGGQGPTNAITVRRAHRFPSAGGVKLIVMRYTGGEWAMVTSSYRTVTASDETSVTFSGTPLTVLDNDYLVNLGNDSGVGTPLFDGSPVDLFTDPEGKTTRFGSSSITPNVKGDYWYFTREDRLWEVVRNGMTPVAMILDMLETEDVPRSVRWAHKFATSGSGATTTDPWATSGSNPVQAALDDLPSTGGTVMMLPGHFNMGSAAIAVNVPILTGTTDKRAYTFRGAGRDLTFLRYSGTGSCFRYPQVNTGVVMSSFQSNQIVFGDFAVQQVGTARTGAAFFMTYASYCKFENLSIGSVRMDHQGGEPDNGFAYGIRLDQPVAPPPGDNVVDFNTVDGCYFKGNTQAIYIQNQGDRTLVMNSTFEPFQTAAVAQDGLWVHNSGAVSVFNCNFNFFDFGANSYGVKLSGECNGALIHGCYFERNKTGVYFLNDENQGGFSVSSCQFSFNAATTSVGVRAGLDSAIFTLTGLTVESCSFYRLSAGNTGIRIADTVRGYRVGPNRYDNTGGTNVTRQTGCRGIMTDTDVNGFPIVRITETAEASGRIILENTSAIAGRSPQIDLQPGASASKMSLVVSAAGHMQFMDANGLAVFDVDQTGNYTHYPLGPALAAQWIRGSATELVTILSGGVTQTTIDLPANSIIESVVGRVVTVIPTATTFHVGDSLISTRFATDVPVAAGTTFVGLNHVDATGTSGPKQVAAAKVWFAMQGGVPATATGQVRVVIYYRKLVAPAS